eukprot:tig00020849_g14627.t1
MSSGTGASAEYHIRMANLAPFTAEPSTLSGIPTNALEMLRRIPPLQPGADRQTVEDHLAAFEAAAALSRNILNLAEDAGDSQQQNTGLALVQTLDPAHSVRSEIELFHAGQRARKSELAKLKSEKAEKERLGAANEHELMLLEGLGEQIAEIEEAIVASKRETTFAAIRARLESDSGERNPDDLKEVLRLPYLGENPEACVRRTCRLCMHPDARQLLENPLSALVRQLGDMIARRNRGAYREFDDVKDLSEKDRRRMLKNLEVLTVVQAELAQRVREGLLKDEVALVNYVRKRCRELGAWDTDISNVPGSAYVVKRSALPSAAPAQAPSAMQSLQRAAMHAAPPAVPVVPPGSRASKDARVMRAHTHEAYDGGYDDGVADDAQTEELVMFCRYAFAGDDEEVDVVIRAIYPSSSAPPPRPDDPVYRQKITEFLRERGLPAQPRNPCHCGKRHWKFECDVSPTPLPDWAVINPNKRRAGGFGGEAKRRPQGGNFSPAPPSGNGPLSATALASAPATSPASEAATFAIARAILSEAVRGGPSLLGSPSTPAASPGSGPTAAPAPAELGKERRVFRVKIDRTSASTGLELARAFERFSAVTTEHAAALHKDESLSTCAAAATAFAIGLVQIISAARPDLCPEEETVIDMRARPESGLAETEKTATEPIAAGIGPGLSAGLSSFADIMNAADLGTFALESAAAPDPTEVEGADAEAKGSDVAALQPASSGGDADALAIGSLESAVAATCVKGDVDPAAGVGPCLEYSSGAETVASLSVTDDGASAAEEDREAASKECIRTNRAYLARAGFTVAHFGALNLTEEPGREAELGPAILWDVQGHKLKGAAPVELGREGFVYPNPRLSHCVTYCLEGLVEQPEVQWYATAFRCPGRTRQAFSFLLSALTQPFADESVYTDSPTLPTAFLHMLGHSSASRDLLAHAWPTRYLSTMHLVRQVGLHAQRVAKGRPWPTKGLTAFGKQEVEPDLQKLRPGEIAIAGWLEGYRGHESVGSQSPIALALAPHEMQLMGSTRLGRGQLVSDQTRLRLAAAACVAGYYLHRLDYGAPGSSKAAEKILQRYFDFAAPLMVDEHTDAYGLALVLLEHWARWKTAGSFGGHTGRIDLHKCAALLASEAVPAPSDFDFTTAVHLLTTAALSLELPVPSAKVLHSVKDTEGWLARAAHERHEAYRKGRAPDYSRLSDACVVERMSVGEGLAAERILALRDLPLCTAWLYALLGHRPPAPGDSKAPVPTGWYLGLVRPATRGTQLTLHADKDAGRQPTIIPEEVSILSPLGPTEPLETLKSLVHIKTVTGSAGSARLIKYIEGTPPHSRAHLILLYRRLKRKSGGLSDEEVDQLIAFAEKWRLDPSCPTTTPVASKLDREAHARALDGQATVKAIGLTLQAAAALVPQTAAPEPAILPGGRLSPPRTPTPALNPAHEPGPLAGGKPRQAAAGGAKGQGRGGGRRGQGRGRKGAQGQEPQKDKEGDVPMSEKRDEGGGGGEGPSEPTQPASQPEPAGTPDADDPAQYALYEALGVIGGALVVPRVSPHNRGKSLENWPPAQRKILAARWGIETSAVKGTLETLRVPHLKDFIIEECGSQPYERADNPLPAVVPLAGLPARRAPSSIRIARENAAALELLMLGLGLVSEITPQTDGLPTSLHDWAQDDVEWYLTARWRIPQPRTPAWVHENRFNPNAVVIPSSVARYLLQAHALLLDEAPAAEAPSAARAALELPKGLRWARKYLRLASRASIFETAATAEWAAMRDSILKMLRRPKTYAVDEARLAGADTDEPDPPRP